MRFLIKVDFKNGCCLQGDYWTGLDSATTSKRKNATVFHSKDIPAILLRCKKEGVNFKHIAKLIPLH